MHSLGTLDELNTMSNRSVFVNGIVFGFVVELYYMQGSNPDPFKPYVHE
jgi:hypothetical protein